MIPLMMQKDYSPKGWCKSQHRSLRSVNRYLRHTVDMRSSCW